MPLSLFYWVLLLLWILGSLWWGWRAGASSPPYPVIGGGLLLFLLFLVIGLKIFGPILRGG